MGGMNDMTREEWREIMTPYVSQDPDYESKKKWREENREGDRKSKLAWYHRNEGRPYKKTEETLEHRRLRLQKRKQLYQAKKFPGAQEALLQQKGLCAICGKPETTKKRGITQSLSLDHDHATGRFRGWLCLKCNIALGSVGDSPILLQKMQDYLLGF